MGTVLNKRLRTSRFESPYHEAMLNLLVGAGHIDGMIESACGEFGISHPQYNILRILRGAQPDGYPCGEIAFRMLNRAPDITRRLDGLEKEGYVVRDRLSRDRRVVITRITPKGLDLLKQMDPRLAEVVGFLASRIPADDALELSRIVERLYGEGT